MIRYYIILYVLISVFVLGENLTTQQLVANVFIFLGVGILTCSKLLEGPS